VATTGVAFGGTRRMPEQQELLLVVPLHPGTSRARHGFELQLNRKEISLLRKPITETSGGYQSAMREAASRIYPDGTWKVSETLMRRLFQMCTKQGRHGGYQKRLPMEKLSPIFAAFRKDWQGTWFYGRHEQGDSARVKFGKTDRPERRVREYSTDNPRQLVTLFCIWDTSGSYERRVKARFATSRDGTRRREWFLRTPEVEAFIRQCRCVQSTDELPGYDK
jgi:Meiotically Up-regulated Gene 113 (MUG113) protein